MLKWIKDYTVSERIRNPEKVRRKIDAGEAVPGIFLITKSYNEHNLLEIVPAISLVQRNACAMCPEIIGMAKGKEDAMEMVQNILEAVYRRTGDFCMVSFDPDIL
ncbi:MAG: hypothetical protein MRZ74_06865 [Blautia sp.]|nr:hypothetical protein [Blautia sp.]MDY5032035.1 hypothetical protein [Blautia sp.]